MKSRYVNEILHSFPYPISSRFIKLETDECLDPGPLRLQYIWLSSEAICRFLGVIVLCECRELAENRPELVTSFPRNLLKQFKRPSWGIWINIIREGLKYLHQHQATLLMPELYGFYFDQQQKPTAAASALDHVLTVRNAYNHDKLKALHSHQFAKLCEQSYPLLTTALEALHFLLDYELVFISQINVDKGRKQPSSYHHHIKKISGESDEFKGARDRLDFNMDTQSALLLNPDNKQYLNLDPLLVYEAEAGKAPDVFFYNGMKNPNNASYIACKHGEFFNSNDAARANILSTELQQLLDLFGTENRRQSHEPAE